MNSIRAHSRPFAAIFALTAAAFAADLPPNQWVELRRDPAGARPGSSLRYVPETRAFYLWGFMNDDPNLLQEHPLMPVPEYDMVRFDLDDGRWRSERERFTAAYIPRTYSGKTTGSERTLMHGPTEERGGVPRPDLNLVFNQVAWHPGLHSLVYFTGGLTAAYHVAGKRWRDLAPAHVPPPVVGGSLAYDPVNDQIVLFGGGHVAERAPDGRIVGYTGTWIYRHQENDWRQWPLLVSPPPRMNTRLVCDAKTQALVLFGGDAQSHYLADTWLFDLKTQSWRASKGAGPEARAGHFTVYDPETGWVLIGGGYNTKDLTDMWAYDAREDRWHRLPGEVPTGFYLSADLAPAKRLLLLSTATRKPGDRMTCNILYPVRSTYAYRIAPVDLAPSPAPASPPSLPKLSPLPAQHPKPDPVGFPNQWVLWNDEGRARTWGSATLDTSRGLILYWGGGHCGYEGNDVDAFDIDRRAWRTTGVAEYPERTWERGVRPAGVTFGGGPWTDHGRKIYSYDPVSRKMIMARPIRLTTDYNPEPLHEFRLRRAPLVDALVNPPSSYVAYATWSWDPDTGRWEILGDAPVGVDTLVTTSHGVVGVRVDWPAKLNDAGYLLPFRPAFRKDTPIYLLDKEWKRLDADPQPQPGPQGLYEMTGLAYDSKRDQVILHGGGPKRDEIWTFDMKKHTWEQKHPAGALPTCTREAVYIPREDVFLTYGPSPENPTMPALHAYHVGENAWSRVTVPPMREIEPARRASQNRAMVYDPERDLVLLVLGTGGDAGKAYVYAMRYRNAGR